MKILWLTPKWTFPVNDGARVATDTLVRNSIKDCHVDIACIGLLKERTADFEQMRKAWPIKSIFYLNRSLPLKTSSKAIYYLKQLIKKPFFPLTVSSFNERSIKHELTKIINNGSYDLIILEGLHLFASLDFDKLKNKPKIIYRAHNLEMEIWQRAALETSNIIKKLFYYFQYKLVEKFETKCLEYVDGVAAISEEDLVNFKTMANCKKLELIPLGLDFNHPLEIQDSSRLELLFVGRLDWPPNKDGLLWFLENVWPKVIAKRDNLNLTIVGSGDSRWLEKYKTLKGIDFQGRIDDINTAYSKTQFSIAPIFYGSGTRIKVLETFAKGRPLITTQMGVQGANLSEADFYRCESADEWIQLLTSLNFNDKVLNQLENTRSHLKLKFDEVEVGNRFYSWLKTFV